MRLLVVDDSRAMRMILSRELRDLESVEDVLEADSAEAAVEVLGSEPLDLVVCDWNMPGMSGLELLEALRSAGWTVPFGFVTSESSVEVVQAATAAGASFLLAKPFGGDELCERVAAALGGSSSRVRRSDEGELDRPGALRALLEGLLRKEVTVVPAASGPARQAARWTAEYVDATGQRVALFVVETPLASAFSAALTMMPPSVASEWASSGALPDLLWENFHEVSNVIAKAVRADGERCSLSEIAGFAPGEQLPLIAEIRAARWNESYEVRVAGYGTGLLSLVTL